MKYILFLLVLFSLIFIGCEKQSDQTESKEMTMLKEQIAKFAPTELKYDKSNLTEREQKVVEKLYYASKIMDEIFLDQVYSKNYRIRKELKSGDSEKLKLELELFNMMFGPFDRLEHEAPFIGKEKKPLGANFYPEDC